MTESDLFNLLVKCNAAQLDAVAVRLGLDQAFLPGRNEPIATRAGAIIQLVKQPRGRGLATLEEILDELFGRPKEPKPRCILILAANPIETERLRLDEEVRTIKERLNEAEPGRRYTVGSEWAVRVTDLSKYLLQHKPVIVHLNVA